MTAGSGILHDELPTERMYRLGGPAHAVQLWVNLPSSLKFTTPRYQAITRADLLLLTSDDGGALLRLIAGNMVVELQPLCYGKDGAIAAFMAEPPFGGRLPVFLGDDTTDEDGFAEINRRGGVSIRVGTPAAATAASFVLPSVAAALAWLAGSSPA
jgi:trehalose-phosphatase